MVCEVLYNKRLEKKEAENRHLFHRYGKTTHDQSELDSTSSLSRRFVIMWQTNKCHILHMIKTGLLVLSIRIPIFLTPSMMILNVYGDCYEPHTIRWMCVVRKKKIFNRKWILFRTRHTQKMFSKMKRFAPTNTHRCKKWSAYRGLFHFFWCSTHETRHIIHNDNVIREKFIH